MSRSEEILQALVSLLTGALPFAPVRNATIPEKVDGPGFVTIGDGSPGDPVDVTLSPVRYSYDHVVPVDIAVQNGDIDAKFEQIRSAIGQAIDVDRTLGGLCEWIELDPLGAEGGSVFGAGPFKVGTVNLIVSYETANPLT